MTTLLPKSCSLSSTCSINLALNTHSNFGQSERHKIMLPGLKNDIYLFVCVSVCVCGCTCATMNTWIWFFQHVGAGDPVQIVGSVWWQVPSCWPSPGCNFHFPVTCVVIFLVLLDT